ncbi:MAG: orotidine-5'-phosphate decarboxylase [Candidatus Fimenecus sp.]
MSFKKLIDYIEEKDNATVAGLDPKLAYIPYFIKSKAFSKYGETFEGAAEALFEFNKRLIDELYDIVPAVKIQAAYYEMYGWNGIKCMNLTAEYAKKNGLYVIIDCKRNDIGTTMGAYASAYLGETEIGREKKAAFSADCITVNGYLGYDGIKPVMDEAAKNDKAFFVLAKTSNKSSGDLQDRLIDGNPVFENMCMLIDKWGKETDTVKGYHSIGAVVGATYPEELKLLRNEFKNIFFLVPGYGAQGAGAKELKGAFDTNGLGALINNSRGIMCAYKTLGYDEENFAKAARESALNMKNALNEVR